MRREIPVDPQKLARMAGPAPEECDRPHVLTDALKVLCPRRIESPRDAARYNATWARIDGLSFRQIAEECSISLGYAHKIIHRAATAAPHLADVLRVRPGRRAFPGFPLPVAS